MSVAYTVKVLPTAAADLRRLEAFAIERELESETPDWEAPERALKAIHDGLRLLTWSPFTCRKARWADGRSRELVIPFGGTGYVALFEVVGQQVVVTAVRHQREDDTRT